MTSKVDTTSKSNLIASLAPVLSLTQQGLKQKIWWGCKVFILDMQKAQWPRQSEWQKLARQLKKVILSSSSSSKCLRYYLKRCKLRLQILFQRLWMAASRPLPWRLSWTNNKNYWMSIWRSILQVGKLHSKILTNQSIFRLESSSKIAAALMDYQLPTISLKVRYKMSSTLNWRSRASLFWLYVAQNQQKLLSSNFQQSFMNYLQISVCKQILRLISALQIWTAL